MKIRFLFTLLIVCICFSLQSCSDDDENQNQNQDPTRMMIGESRTNLIASENRWNDVAINVEAGESYKITSMGTWVDLNNECDANGYSDPFLDSFSNLKRVPDALWFELIASVDTSFNYIVGSDSTITFTESGSLSFFANDADAFYGNNSGSISTNIVRQ